MTDIIGTLLAVGPFIVLTLCIFGAGFLCGALWAGVRANEKSGDLYGDLALRLGTSRTAVMKAVLGKCAA